MNNFQRGDLSPVSWAPQNLGFTALLNVKESTVDVMVILFDVSHTGLGGDTGRIRGKRDASGTVHASIDLDAPPWGNTVVLNEGQPGIMLQFVGPTKAIQLPMCVERLHFQGANMQKECDYSFDAKMNKLAGFLVYPTFP